MSTNTYQFLLEEYRTIWKNRILLSENSSAEEILMETIKRELLDENSHPRARKPIHDKYVSASKRIIQSDLSSDTKVELIRLHVELLQQLK
ncbi:hypothetical protein [Rossellomorea sp. NS-SX7]|uniref:hypothetical protein n=1 Tax=Rossellomorea sp. NS-SX7 TaxID=3463856 RepID=UPI00405A0E3E